MEVQLDLQVYYSPNPFQQTGRFVRLLTLADDLL
jgi:hypothetical protein